MDLRSGHPYWPLADPPQPRYPALTKDIACDVCVVGAGISGALAAYELARAGLRVVVADRRQPGRGSTAASTALLMYDLDVPLHELADRIGEEKAQRCYRVGVEAIDRIAEIAADLLDPCGFERRPSLLIAHDPKANEMIEREVVARREAGLEVTPLTRDEIEARYSFTAPGALWSPAAAEIDGYRFTHALLDDAFDHGALIYGHTRVGLPESGPPYRLPTDSGGEITAEHVVLAGGYEAIEAVGMPTRNKLISTYAVATTPVEAFKGWEDRALLWTTSKPYLYLRTTPDNRIIVGGSDEPLTDPDERDALIGEKANALMARLWHLFPKLRPEPEYAWAGFFIETPDGLPYIGAVPGKKGVYVSLCYGANGTTLAAAGARIIREMIVEKTSKDAHLFGVDRA
ncbi:MAG TPA: FAD-dependent oxidoreductase [Phycisphaerales bacterium]|nr:FAD-dependent oxidoreductase [Phycisphaerales bacterium]